MWKQLLPGLRMTLLMTVLTGLIYPGIVTGLCQLAFPSKANGSLITANGRTIGSEIIGQNFTRPEYFWPRPSAAGNDGYDPTASGASNLGPTSQKLVDRVKVSMAKARRDNPGLTGSLPSDLVTASGSGLDPHISPDSARVQVARVAAARKTSPAAIQSVVDEATEGRDLGILGEPRVNVLKLNIALDTKVPMR